jgi:hypothetical protein
MIHLKRCRVTVDKLSEYDRYYLHFRVEISGGLICQFEKLFSPNPTESELEYIILSAMESLKQHLKGLA